MSRPYLTLWIARLALLTTALCPALVRAASPALNVELAPSAGARGSLDPQGLARRGPEASAVTGAAPSPSPSPSPSPVPPAPSVMSRPAGVEAPAPLEMTPAVDAPASASFAVEPRAPLEPRARPALIPPPRAGAPDHAEEPEDPQPRRRGRGMMIGGFSMFGGAYLSTNLMFGIFGGVDNRLAVPMIGPLLLISEFDGILAAALGASAAVQVTGLVLGGTGAILHFHDDRALPRGPRHGLGLMMTGLSVFGASYFFGAMTGSGAQGQQYIPVFGPLILAAESGDGFQGLRVATSLFQAVGLTIGVVGALRLGRARARVRAQAGAINADGVQLTKSGLRVNVGPAPRLDGGVVRLTYRW